jgi:hypothetical protein
LPGRRSHGERDWSPDFESEATPRWVEPLAWDSAGRLYSLWTDKKGVRLARSDDRGATWTTRTVAETAAPAFFPYLVARGPGELAATWFTASSREMKDLHWYAARIDGERVLVSAAQTMDSGRPREPGGPLFNDPAGEYLPIAFLRDGTLGVVTPVQNVPAERKGFTWWRFAAR